MSALWPRWYRPPVRFRSDIIANTAMRFGVSSSDLAGPSRKRPIANARQDAMLHLHQQGWSYASIGRLLNRNHTTVMHGVARARARLAA